MDKRISSGTSLLNRTLTCLLLLGLLLAHGSFCRQMALAAVTPASPSAPIADKWAVVIGISKFADPRVPALKYSAKDAKDFYDYLVDPSGGKFRPDHVQLLTDGDATKVNIMDTIGDSFLPHAAAPDDLVVIYLSTHGSPAGADIRGVNYVVAADTQVDKLFATGLEMRQLLRIIKERVHTKRILLVMDTCYSGAGASEGHKGLSRSNIDPQGLAQGIGSIVISSSSPDQRAWESDGLRNSYFTRFLIDSLKEDSGKTPLSQCFNSMKQKVQSSVLRDKGEMQTPVIAGAFTGPSLILGVPPSIVRSAPASVPLPASSASGKSFGGGNMSDYVEKMKAAHALIDQHKFWDASHELEQATKLNPTSVEAFLVSSDVLDAQGRYNEALEAAKRGTLNDDDSSESHEKLGRAYFRLGYVDEALRQMQKSITLDPSNSMAHNLLGYINERKLNRTDLAEQEYRKALELNPLNLRAMINLGKLLEGQGRETDATETLFRKAIESDADDWEARLALGQFLQNKKGKYAEAETQIRKGIELAPSNGVLHSELGNSLAADKARLDDAEAEYRKGIELSPSSGYAHYVFGRFLIEARDRFDEGEKELRAALDLDADLDAARVLLGDLVVARHKAYDQADAQYKKALATNPRNAAAHVGLATIASELFHNYPQSEAELRKALVIEPNNCLAHIKLGLLMDTLHRQDEARQEFKKAMACDAGNADPHYYLAMLDLEFPKGKFDEEALSELQQAVALAPSVSRGHTKLGFLLTDRYKKHKEAEAQFRQAIEHNIADSEAHYRLGMLLIEKLNQRKSGEHELSTAREQNPGDPEIKAAFERFVR